MKITFWNGFEDEELDDNDFEGCPNFQEVKKIERLAYNEIKIFYKNGSIACVKKINGIYGWNGSRTVFM